MNKKKQDLIHPGSRVRVRDPLLPEEEAWKNALPGVVTKLQTNGLLVLLDGESKADFHLWADVDVLAKPRPQLLDLPIVEIHPSRWQYRRNWDPDKLLELATSIRDHGLLNRILVFRDEDGGYELIAGERRLRASWALAMVRAQRHGDLPAAIAAVAAADWWKAPPVLAIDPTEAVPVELRSGAASDFREIVIVENMIRADPTAIEEAEAFKLLLDEEGYTQGRLAERLGKSQGYISQRLGLLGLSAEVRATVESAEISFTAARAIATLPAAVQAPVTELVKKLAAAEGDSQATTRKVQAMATQVRKFLDPAHWAPPSDRVISAYIRNRLWLARRLVERLPAERAADVLKLRHDDQSWEKSSLGAKPESLVAGYRFDEVVRVLSGEGLDDAWARLANTDGHTCTHCIFRVIVKPNPALDGYCKRWIHGAGVSTCDLFTGPGDPVVIPVYDEAYRRAKELGLVGVIAEPFPHCDNIQTWKEIQSKAAAARELEIDRRDEKRRRQHIRPLREYWEAQHVGSWGLMRYLDEPQAHACTRCCNYRPNLLADGLAPCRLSAEPLKSRWSSEPCAPEFGVLFREDGAMVPRCAEFRFAELPDIEPLDGFTIKPQGSARGSVIAWLQRICKLCGMQQTHNNTIRPPLAWLPYDRSDDANANHEAVARYVNRHWDEIGDGGVAHLLDIALAEARAGGKYQEPIQLADHTSDCANEWCSVSWKNFVAGDEGPAYGTSQVPKGWPRPWIGVARTKLLLDDEEASQ